MAKKYTVQNTGKLAIELSIDGKKVVVKSDKSIDLKAVHMPQAVEKGLIILGPAGASIPFRKDVKINIIPPKEKDEVNLVQYFVPEGLVKEKTETNEFQEDAVDYNNVEIEVIDESEIGAPKQLDQLTPNDGGIEAFISMTSGKDLTNTPIKEFKKYELEEFCKEQNWDTTNAKKDELITIVGQNLSNMVQ